MHHREVLSAYDPIDGLDNGLMWSQLSSLLIKSWKSSMLFNPAFDFQYSCEAAAGVLLFWILSARLFDSWMNLFQSFAQRRKSCSHYREGFDIQPAIL